MHGPMGESSYTKEVSNVIKYIHSDTPVKDSLYEHATLYFIDADKDMAKKKQLTLQVKEARQALVEASSKDKKKLEIELQSAEYLFNEEIKIQKIAQQKRQERVYQLCESIIRLSEGSDYDETQTNSAKILGTLLLLSPHEGAKLAGFHQKLKPVYKAVLALRLLDKLIEEEIITNNFILQKHQKDERYSEEENDISLFQRDVCVPVILAALIQDIGLQHPSAQLILKGAEGDLDEYRVLENDARIALLKINYQQSLNYLIHGLGLVIYRGNSREEKKLFDENEKTRLQFTKSLLTDSIKPKMAEGNLLKIPQIYASVVFSTKKGSNLINLPKATLVLEKAAQMKSINAEFTQYFIGIVGHFPQGFGITYIPKDRENQDLEHYEYAIVFALNPKNPFVPVCRTATRHLTFNSVGKRIAVPIESNLYFATTRKKFSTISPERLEAILKKLSSNFEERKNLDLIPSHWNPYGYFGFKKFQNLWKKGN
ncbi:hypothetical protein [Paraglaciecola sp.]|uniref:hypothetical protein n=1 Tax=Paraglaciecola sp. TaxID=1920173 RepID=UPI0030F3FE75